ncbi:MAG TPA: HAD family hydrolase [Candidatus Aminicenantes bacterium]|nr:HAD family hydrolase [Candidatus Aminicenantes bacterium]
MPPVQAVVFDLDGTLLDSLADIAEAANRSLKQAGFPHHPPGQYAIFVGNGMRTMVERIIPSDSLDKDTVEAVLAGVRRHYARNWRNHTRPYPGIAPLISGLHRRGTHLAVLSNKPREFLEKQVQWFFPDNPFSAVVGAEKETPLKPDPTALLKLIKTMDCLPQNTLMVGDTAVDIHTAHAAGAVAAGVLWGFRSQEELESAGAEILVGFPAELLSFIDRAECGCPTRHRNR